MKNYYSRINYLRQEMTAEIVEYLKKLKHNFILIPDQDDYDDGTWVMWVDDDGYGHDGRVTKISLYGEDRFSIQAEDNDGETAILYSGNDIGCNHVEWLESILSMLKDLIDGESWRYCHECGKAISEGFVVSQGDEYYCFEECLHKHYSPEQWVEMCKQGLSEEEIDDGVTCGDHNYLTTFYNEN